MGEITVGQVLFALNAVIIGIVGFLFRNWMEGVKQTMRDQRDEWRKERDDLWTEIRIVRERSHNQANEIQQRVEWAYCRDCPKKKRGA